MKTIFFYSLLVLFLGLSLTGHADGPVIIPPTLPSTQSAPFRMESDVELFFEEGCEDVLIEVYNSEGLLLSQAVVDVSDNSYVMLDIGEYQSIYIINVHWNNRFKQLIVEYN